MAFLEQRGPKLFLVHRLDAGVKGRELGLELMRAVPLAPPAGREGLYKPVAASRDNVGRLGRAKIMSYGHIAPRPLVDLQFRIQPALDLIAVFPIVFL